MSPTPQTETLATVSLVLSVIGAALFCCWFFGVPLSIGGVVTGVVARKKIAESNGMLSGDGLALAGIIVGGIAAALGVVFFVLGFVSSTWTYL